MDNGQGHQQGRTSGVRAEAALQGGDLPGVRADRDALPTVDAGATSEPLPPTTAGGGYAVHYAAFASQADAEAILRQLGRSGLTGYREAFTLNGKPAQRVRLGPYASRAEAEIVRVRAAQVRDDVTPRVVALDAATPASTPAPASTPTPAPAPQAVTTTPLPAADTPRPQAPAPTPAPTPARRAASVLSTTAAKRSCARACAPRPGTSARASTSARRWAPAG